MSGLSWRPSLGWLGWQGRRWTLHDTAGKEIGRVVRFVDGTANASLHPCCKLFELELPGGSLREAACALLAELERRGVK